MHKDYKPQELLAEGILKVGKTGYRKLHILWIQFQCITEFSIKKRIAIASICGDGTRKRNSMVTESSVQEQECTRYDDKFAAILTSRRQAGSYLHCQFLRVQEGCKDLCWSHRYWMNNGWEKRWNVFYETFKSCSQMEKLQTIEDTTLHSVGQ